MAQAGQFGILNLVDPASRSLQEVAIDKPEFVIGQDAKCDLVIGRGGVAPQHAVLRYANGYLYLLALQGPTLVNEAPTQQHVLQQGDVIQIMGVNLVYRAPLGRPDAAGAGGGWQAPPAPPQGWAPPAGGYPTPPMGQAQAMRPPQGPPAYAGAPAGTGAIPAQAPAQAPACPPAAGPVSVVQVASGPESRLHMVTGPVSQTVLAQRIHIGRAPTNDIVLDNVQVSRNHAQVQKRGNGYWLVDLGSTNGTFLNGQRVKESPLNKGDRIRISVFNLLFDGQTLQHYSEEGSARIDAIQLRREVAGGKVILHDISLSIFPREFVAVVGVSGAGKSTLMNALSGFRPADRGVVLLNGQDYYRNFDEFRSTLGFVPQDDIIHKELTVYRALHYAAHLRMPEDLSAAEIRQRVEEVMHDLRLTEHQNTPITRLSGGQRKRVSIGVELLTRPRLFFLDEPTSGLDPSTETEMMKICRDLANKGHTLILVTHATKNINLCDKVIFLAKGGYLAFYGSPKDALEYFGTTDFTDIYTLLEDPGKKPEEWDAAYKASPHYQKNVVQRLTEVAALVQQARQHDAPPPQPQAPGAHSKAAGRVSGFRQWRLLTQRYMEIMVRDPGNIGLMLGSAVVVAALLFFFAGDTLLHFDLARFDLPPLATGTIKIDEIGKLAFNARLVTFLATIAVIFFGVNNSIREVAKEIAIYKRERTVNLRIVPYVMSKVFVLALICAIQVAILEATIALHFQVPGAGRELYVKLYLVLFVASLTAMAMGLAFSAFASNENKAASALPILIMPQIFLTGKLPELKGGAAVVTWFGLSKWPFESMGNLFRIWDIFPAQDKITNPMLFDKLQKAFDQNAQYFKDLDINYWGHVSVLGAYFLLFLLLACILQLNKDKVRE